MKRTLKKILAVSLCAALIGGTAVSLPVFVPNGGITASAYSSGDYEYVVSNNNNATITKYKGSGGKVTIPSEIGGYPVKSIMEEAFSFCSSLTKVTIPDSVTSIGNRAFKGCSSLTSVTIPDSVTSIGGGAFYKCSSLTSVTIPDSVTSIDGGAFYGCSSLTSITIPDSVTSIGYGAFNDCSSLTSVTIPDSVTSIGKSAFSYCSSLTSVTIPDSVTSIGGSTFHGCRSLTSVTIPDSVTSIGDYAFCYCSSLTSVTIPDSVTSIGESAFSYCSSLTSVTIPDSVTSIGKLAFYECSSLTSVTIPDSVTSIGDGAFYGCSSLTSINVDKDNKNYSSYDGVLYNKKLTELVCCPGKKTSVTIPDSVTSIGDEAFYRCRSLTSVTIPDSVTSIGDCAFYYCSSLTSVTIPESVTSIGYNTFDGCSSLTSVTIPDTVTSIGDYAFYYCSSLTSVTIPDSVTRIGYGAFYYCRNLTSVTIPDSVTFIGIAAFTGCTSLTIYGEGEKDSAAYTYAIKNRFNFAVKLENTSVINSDTVQIGDKVRVSASAKGGTGGYKYAYYYKRSSNNTWKTLGTEFGTNSSVAFAPTAEASYDIKVVVKDSAGQTAEKLFTVKAVKELELTNVSVVGRTSVKLGSAIPMIGKAVGGAGNYRYSFYFKRSTNETFKLLGTKYTANASARFKPTAKGTYDIRIDVMDKSGKVERKFFTVTVK